MTRERDHGPTDPAALSRAREDLARTRGKRRLDVILDQADPAGLVRALPADELYLTIQEIGLGDAVQLVSLATPEQFRTFLDLACWPGDRIAPRKALPWLRAARAGSSESPVTAARWKAKVAAIDGEVLHLVFRDTLRVHDLESDPDPHLQSDRFMRTPDNRYVLEFLVDGAEYMAVRALVDDLYAEDPFLATRTLASIDWDLPSDLEEAALRWRAGRLADLGYPSRQEALSWFARPSNRTAAPAGTPARPPGFYLERIGRNSFLARSAALLPPAEREHVELELVTAANAVLVADAVDPGDLEAVRAAVATGRTFVEMGLEEASSGDVDRGAEILATTAVKSLFQRGFGRVLALEWRAERLLASGIAGTAAAPLLDSPLAEMLAALARRRPLYFPGLETERDDWGTLASGAFEARPFSSSGEVARTADALTSAEGLARLGATLGLTPTPAAGPLAPRLATLYLTALANERLGRGFVADAIPAGDLGAAARVLERIEDPRLARAGDAGALLAALAGTRAEELAPVRSGTDARPEHVSAILLRSPR